MEQEIKEKLDKFEIQGAWGVIMKAIKDLDKEIDTYIRSPEYKALKEAVKIANSPCHLCRFRSVEKYFNDKGELNPEWLIHLKWHNMHHEDVTLKIIKQWSKEEWPYDWCNKELDKNRNAKTA